MPTAKTAIVCPKCKGKGKQGDYMTMIFPPVFLLGRFIDWIGGDAPMDITYDPCSRCDGEGWITIGGGDWSRLKPNQSNKSGTEKL